jgi:integrase/recombinase XerD
MAFSYQQRSKHMKQLTLTQPSHRVLESAFRSYLTIRGYSAHSIYNLPNFIREFLHWLEQNQLSLQNISHQNMEAYFFHLEHRANQRRDGGVSNCYVHKHLQAVKLFSTYLKETDQYVFEVDIQRHRQEPEARIILTQEEIKRLYKATENTPHTLRDRAMLAIYYGCGLRRNEGVHVGLEDVLLDQQLLYVKQGKKDKERYVPMSQGVIQDLKEYITKGRVQTEESILLLSEKGKPLQGQSHFKRLKYLLKKAQIDKPAGLHSLRHSIATHLLKEGMSLKHIAKFLGHQSLESTQVYTHIAEAYEL